MYTIRLTFPSVSVHMTWTESLPTCMSFSCGTRLHSIGVNRLGNCPVENVMHSEVFPTLLSPTTTTWTSPYRTEVNILGSFYTFVHYQEIYMYV